MLNGSEASSPTCKRQLVPLRRSFTIVQDDKALMLYNSSSPSAEQLRSKSGKTMQAMCAAGIAMFCMQGLKAKGSPGQKYCSPGFA
jgi:hypothetical protein